MKMKTSNHTIPDRSPPELARTAPSVIHQDGDVKIRARDNITIGTWNTRTLRAAGTDTRNGQVQMEHPWTL